MKYPSWGSIDIFSFVVDRLLDLDRDRDREDFLRWLLPHSIEFALLFSLVITETLSLLTSHVASLHIKEIFHGWYLLTLVTIYLLCISIFLVAG